MRSDKKELEAIEGSNGLANKYSYSYNAQTKTYSCVFFLPAGKGRYEVNPAPLGLVICQTIAMQWSAIN